MYNYVDNGWGKTFLKIISIFLIYSLFFTSTANAANVGGWNLSNPIAKGASTVYDATKNVVINGKNFIKESSVKITPTASGVAKVLARGAAGYALSVAVEQLLGSVDWVLDPANNQIVYTEPVDPNTRYVYQFNGVNYTGASAVCNAYYSATAYLEVNNKKSEIRNGGQSVYCSATVKYSCYNGSQVCSMNIGHEFYRTAIIDGPTEEEKTLPLEVVAQQVISNAAGGDTAAQGATMAAAADIVGEAEKDDAKARPIANQADANAETKPADADAAASANTGAATATPQADPVTGEQAPPTDISLKFPVFCNWAPTVCEAAQVVISFPNTLTGWYNDTKTKAEEWATSISEAWTAAKDWAKNEENEEQDNDPPEINTIDIGQLDTGTFQATAGCPAPIQVPVNLGTGGNVEISYEPICQFASKWSFVAPLIGFLSGAMILVGVGRKGEDGEI